MDNDLEALALAVRGGGVPARRLGLVLGLLEVVADLVADQSGLQPAAVGQRRVVRCGRRQMPSLVGCIQAVSVPVEGRALSASGQGRMDEERELADDEPDDEKKRRQACHVHGCA